MEETILGKAMDSDQFATLDPIHTFLSSPTHRDDCHTANQASALVRQLDDVIWIPGIGSKRSAKVNASSLGRDDDIIIAIMGPTGVGKSNFIEKLMGDTTHSKSVISGGGLASYTSDIDPIRIYGHPDYGNRIVLVDTPGFDDTHRSDMEILTLISNWLKQRYEKGVLLSGILYLHRISDNRMSGSPARNLTMFGKLCGSSAAERVVFITTMWDRALDDSGKLEMYQKRHDQLISNYWKPMTDLGAQTGTFNNTTRAAWDVLDMLLKTVQPPAEVVGLSRSISELTAQRPSSLKPKDDDARSMFSVKSTASKLSRNLFYAISSFPPKLWSVMRKEDHQPSDDDELPIPASYSINTVPFPSPPVEEESCVQVVSPSLEAIGSAAGLWLSYERSIIVGNRATRFMQPPEVILPLSRQRTVRIQSTCKSDRHISKPAMFDDHDRLSIQSSPSVYSQPSPIPSSSSDNDTLVCPDEPVAPSYETIPPAESIRTNPTPPTVILHLQSELVNEGKQVHETDAARTLYTGLQTLIHENRNNLKTLLDAEKEDLDEKTRMKLQQDIKVLDSEFQKSFKEMKELEVPRWRRAFLRVHPSNLKVKSRALKMGL